MKSAATQLSEEVFTKWFEERVKPSGKTVSAYLHAFIVGEIQGTSQMSGAPAEDSGDWLICPFRCGQRYSNTADGCSDMRVHAQYCPASFRHAPLYKGPTHF